MTKNEFIDTKIQDLDTLIKDLSECTPKLSGTFYSNNVLSNPILEAKMINEMIKNRNYRVTKSFENNILNDIKNTIKEYMYPNASIRCEFKEILTLQETESFESKTETFNKNRMIGYLIILLPSIYDGGLFTSNIKGLKDDEVSFSMKITDEESKYHWICIYPSLPFKFSKITSGFCHILIYHVYNDNMTPLKDFNFDSIIKAKDSILNLFNLKSIQQDKFGILKNSTKDLIGKEKIIFNFLKLFPDDFNVKIEEVEIFKSSISNCICTYCTKLKQNNINSFGLMQNICLINKKDIQMKWNEHQKPNKINNHIESINLYALVISKRKRKRNEEEDEKDEPEIEILNGSSVNSIKCPISQGRIEEPVKSKLCGHSYDKSSILMYINDKPKECPISGCKKMVSKENLEYDKELALILQNTPISDDEEEEENKEPQQNHSNFGCIIQ